MLRPAGVMDYFLVAAVSCLATIWSLIFSYVARGSTFLETSSSFRL